MVMREKTNKDDDDEPISLKMRVGKWNKNVEIAVLLDGENIASKKKQSVTPGEMETIVLKSDVVKKVKTQGKNMEVTLIAGGAK